MALARFESLIPMLCCLCLCLGMGSHVFGIDEDEPYDPTSPEHVAEQEGEDADSGGGLLSGPSVEPQTASPRRGGGQRGGGAEMGDTNAMGIFAAKCQQCHGPQKQKGGVQLLPMEMIFSGSEEYWYVKKGDPDASELMRRITLPADHDDVMPPDGDMLSASEVKVIEDWIRSGASTEIQATPTRQQRVNPRQWAQVLQGLELTEGQRAEVESTLTAYQRLNAEFDRSHRARMREIEKRMRETRDSNDTITNASMKQELDKLRAQRPKFQDVQEELWSLLTAEQQDLMRNALALAGSNGSSMSGSGSRGRPGGSRSGGTKSALTEDERRRLRELMRERRGGAQGTSPRGSGGPGDED